MRPGAAPPASRSPARGPPQGSCCLRHGNSIHSRPFSPLPCPGALELRGPGRGDESWRPPASQGSRRSRLMKSACQLPPALSAAATCRQGAPEATPPVVAIPRTVNFRVPPTLPSTSRAVDEVEAILCTGRVTHFRNGGLGNRKGGFRIWSGTLRPAASWRPRQMRSASRGPRPTADSSCDCSKALGDSVPPLPSVEWDAPSLVSIRQRAIRWCSRFTPGNVARETHHRTFAPEQMRQLTPPAESKDLSLSLMRGRLALPGRAALRII